MIEVDCNQHKSTSITDCNVVPFTLMDCTEYDEFNPINNTLPTNNNTINNIENVSDVNTTNHTFNDTSTTNVHIQPLNDRIDLTYKKCLFFIFYFFFYLHVLL